MHFKIITLTLFLAVSSNFIVAYEWPEKECNKLSGYVGFLSAASAGSSLGFSASSDASSITSNKMAEYLNLSKIREYSCVYVMQTTMLETGGQQRLIRIITQNNYTNIELTFT